MALTLLDAKASAMRAYCKQTKQTYIEPILFVVAQKIGEATEIRDLLIGQDRSPLSHDPTAGATWYSLASSQSGRLSGHPVSRTSMSSRPCERWSRTNPGPRRARAADYRVARKGGHFGPRSRPRSVDPHNVDIASTTCPGQVTGSNPRLRHVRVSPATPASHAPVSLSAVSRAPGPWSGKVDVAGRPWCLHGGRHCDQKAAHTAVVSGQEPQGDGGGPFTEARTAERPVDAHLVQRRRVAR
jgi:hypothetical protein